MLYPQLKAFHAVANEGGFTRGAAALHRTQPAISAQVKALESRYGVKLFERAGRGVSLTEAGQRLHEITRRIFALEEEAERSLRSARTLRVESLRIAADAPYSLSSILAAYCEIKPDTHVTVTMGTGEDIVRSLFAREIDAAVLVRVQADPRLEIVSYTQHRVVAIVGRGHTWASRNSVSVHDFHGAPTVLRDTRYSLTSQVFEEALSTLHVTPEVTIKVDSRENLREAVGAGRAVGVTAEPDAITDRRLKILPFKDLELSIPDYLVCVKQHRDSPVIHAFLKLAGANPGRRQGIRRSGRASTDKAGLSRR